MVEAAAILDFTDLPGGDRVRNDGVPLFTLYQNSGAVTEEHTAPQAG